MTTYELRTRANAPVYRFDDRMAATREKAKHEARVGIPLRLFEIKTVEREIAA